MVSSICRDPDPHRPLAHGTAIVFFSLQPSGEGGRFGLFPDPRTAIHDPRWLAGLCGYPFLNQLVSRAALRHHRLPSPCCCFVAISLHPYMGCHDANADLPRHPFERVVSQVVSRGIVWEATPIGRSQPYRCFRLTRNVHLREFVYQMP